MIGFSLQHVKLEPSSLKNHLMEIAINFNKCAGFRFSNPHPMGNVVSGNLTKNYLDGKCIKCLDLHTELQFCQPPTPHWSTDEVGVNIPSKFFF